jgi:hypothetical protein
VQVLLSASVYVECGTGWKSARQVMFAASLLAILLVFIREDALKRQADLRHPRRQLVMTLIWAWLRCSCARTVRQLLALPAAMFDQGARVTAWAPVFVFGT